jgi:hypothetical protein
VRGQITALLLICFSAAFLAFCADRDCSPESLSAVSSSSPNF